MIQLIPYKQTSSYSLRTIKLLRHDKRKQRKGKRDHVKERTDWLMWWLLQGSSSPSNLPLLIDSTDSTKLNKDSTQQWTQLISTHET